MRDALVKIYLFVYQATKKPASSNTITMDGGPTSVFRDAPQCSKTQVIYLGICGIPGSPFYMNDSYTFRFTVDCPSALCNLPAGEAVDHDAESQFVQNVISLYNQEIFSAREWRCQICGKPAKELYHAMVPFLSSGRGSLASFQPFIALQPSSAFQPSVWDSVIPICVAAGMCDRKAEEVAKGFFTNALPGTFLHPEYACIAQRDANHYTGQITRGTVVRHRKNVPKRRTKSACEHADVRISSQNHGRKGHAGFSEL
ncbi:conserved hypothetical protein [Histoplasma capsulatum G186AR]|uniref:Uncharacterized protein n=1 Tax=Ajellomyces capsulatus (strain G186AR / H82 / ATCC MYA-2454 / RMSCC 2432) TaxID=447093 RepID=C0NZ41_AJECG|nr:uncharacterized protein HCBG_08421 [Histoplasma capsulatum G186AR]EEH03481.1 conserved hypothetical protein [Histoplasma capsulatum G186AR]